jgi:hypothetical protein
MEYYGEMHHAITKHHCADTVKARGWEEIISTYALYDDISAGQERSVK